MDRKTAVQIEHIKTECLIPYARNARTHTDPQVSQIAASIREFGFTNPVLLAKDRTIIAGHGRVLAARKLGLDEVPCLVLGHLSDAQAKALALADNRIPLNAGWDVDLLKLELADLKDAGQELALLGFSEHELRTLLLDSPVVQPKEFTEDVADGVVVHAAFKVQVPVADAENFEEGLDDLLRRFPEAKKEKSV